MNKLLQEFFDNMHVKKIRYCHWKSNNNLELALSGVDDVDILVDCHQFTDFMAIISVLGFRQAEDKYGVNNPFVFHYYGYDDDSSEVMHLHVYFRIVTGGSIFKNHVIPVEELFLSSRREYMGVFIPAPEIDYSLLIIRKMIEQPSVVEHFLFLKDLPNIHNEMDWLLKQIDSKKLKNVVENNFSNLTYSAFQECVESIRKRSDYFKRIRLGISMSMRFPGRAASSWVASKSRFFGLFGAYVRARIKSSKLHRVQLPGGIIVSFVGSEASGKSTLSEMLYNDLNKMFRVSRVHLGKPPKSILSKLIWWMIRLLVSIKYIIKKPFSYFLSKKKDTNNAEKVNFSNYEPHPVIACIDSYDRNRALQKCVREAMYGGIVITDRLPGKDLGQIDGPRIQHISGIYGLLGRLERYFYASAPSVDLVYRVSAPLEITLNRNLQREKSEPEDFVRMRYEQFQKAIFPGANLVDIDTTQDLNSCNKLVRKSFFGFYTGKTPGIQCD